MKAIIVWSGDVVQCCHTDMHEHWYFRIEKGREGSRLFCVHHVEDLWAALLCDHEYTHACIS
jgi:hypothetical protein